MAFALPAAASAIATAAPAAVAKVGLMATLKTVGLKIAMNVAISAAMSALQPQVGAAGRTDEWTLSPDGPIPFAAGRIGVPGAVVYRKTFGPDLMYYGIPSVLSGAGPIDGFESFMADDETVTFDGNGKAVTSQYANELWYRNRLGAQPDTALTSPSGLKGGASLPGWTSAHKLSGKASYMVVMGENSKGTAYPTGEIKPIVVFRGLKVYDPRKDSTYPGGSGPHRLHDPSTWQYSTNPILWALKWVLGLWEGPTLKGAPAHGSTTDCQVGGLGSKWAGVDVPAFVNAANIADANGWTVCAYPTTDDDKSQVLDSFLQAGGAIYATRAGKVSCIQRSAPRPSIVTISAADTAGPLEIDTAASRIDRINTIRPRIISEAHRWQLTAIPEVTAAAYRLEDGGTRPRGIDYSYVSNATQGAQLAALQIANTREGIAGVIPLKPHLQKIKPGDAFTITEPGFVLNGLKCLCLTTDYDPATGIVRVSFVSETDSKYPFALGQTSNPPAPPVLTPEDRTVTPPQAGEWTLAATSFTAGGASVPALLFSGAVDNAMAQSVIFEFRPVGSADWSGAGTEEPTIIRKEAGGGLLTAGTAYEGAVSYRIGANFSTRLILGPVTASATVTPPAPALGNVAGTPALTINTGIAADGAEASLLTSSWSGVVGASSYDIEIDDGAGGWFESSPVASLKNVRVRTGLTYRVRIRAVNRDGVRSASWSAWSASVAAGGDTTAPGVVTASSVTALARRCVLVWTNPTDADFSHVRLYRNITGSAHTEADLYAVRVEGSTYTDTNVQAGVTYSYAAKTVDRTGNIGAFKFVGAATPTYITAGGGGGVFPDIAPNDPEIVTEFGTSALVFGQGPGATAPAAQVMNNRTEGDTSFIALPEGGAKVGASSQTGAVKIILPPGAVGAGKDSMVQMSVDIYEYGASASTTYVLRGYTFNGGSRFMNVSAQLLGARTVTRPVRFGFDTVLGRFCVWIGDPGGAWAYPNVRVRDVTVGYGNFAEAVWRSGWQVEFSTGAQFYNPADVVALPRAGDTVFGEGVFEVAGGIVATRPNFRTDQGTAALVAGQGPLVTLTPPPYASNAAALSSGATIGSAYMNTTTGLLDTVIAPGAGTIGYKHFASAPGGSSVTGSVSGVVAGSLLNVTVTMQGGSLSADAAMTGTITVEEGVGGVYSQVGQVQTVMINSTGLIEPGGSYSAENASASVIAAGSKSGSVTYRVSFARTSGPTYVNGAVIDVSMTITPPL